MSRCFPYPSPGYVRNGTSGGEAKALINSIKIERENEKSRKIRKKEKKEKKREKDEKSKHNALEKSDIRKKLDCVGVDGKLKDGKKSFKDEVEQLEKSDITEELGQAAPAESLCYISDGTQSSTKKRKRNPPPSSEIASIRTEGNIIRIMLPLKKHREPVVPFVEKNEPCATLGRSDSEVPSTSGRAEVPAESKPQSVSKDKQTPDSLYNVLICDWVPPPLHYQSLDQYDDEDWLFQTKRQDMKEAVKIKDIQLPSSASTGFWRRAHFLPEANIYALPFTVPF